MSLKMFYIILLVLRLKELTSVFINIYVSYYINIRGAFGPDIRNKQMICIAWQPIYCPGNVIYPMLA